MAEIFQKVNWIDLLIVIVLARSSYIGFTKGLGWEFFRFIGYIGAALVSIYYYDFGSQLISDYFPAVYTVSNFLSFTALYLVILLIFKFINILLEKIIKIEVFSTLERAGGFFFGLGRGGIILSLLLISLMLAPIPYFEKSVKERSYIGRPVSMITPFLYDKFAKLFPNLSSGQRGAAISKLTGYGYGVSALQGVKTTIKEYQKGSTRGLK